MLDSGSDRPGILFQQNDDNERFVSPKGRVVFCGIVDSVQMLTKTFRLPGVTGYETLTSSTLIGLPWSRTSGGLTAVAANSNKENQSRPFDSRSIPIKPVKL
jgi:hypothetical protein